ncbi:lipoyl synthase [Tepidibacter aestuarii]|uniref:lipoyl synthase n=1 Tax=Tepidibacter aestuarii TaxID=2925782 RepID=UPI0020BDDE91|nr:lipoyl synthase [Tepidibacter aestuarii]CAH2213032.1 lipoyl synthase [Tepidibacter aestuarii]
MTVKRKPEWLRIDLKTGRSLDYVNNILKEFSLNTVCQEAKCPNRMECFSKKTATFMILGSECSRGCKFCNVSHGELEKVDENEPENVAKATVELGLKHVVITSVTRDDLPDGGAEHFSKVINKIREKDSNIIIEVLIPDLQGNEIALKKIIDAKPHVINHNMETVSRLYENVRPQAIYERSLKVLENVKKIDPSIYTKSGIMVGLGEREDEVLDLLKDLREVGCDYLTIGQYLAPSKEHYPIEEYVHPDTFKKYKEEGLSMGFSFVASDPLVRSSYNAAEMLSHA